MKSYASALENSGLRVAIFQEGYPKTRLTVENSKEMRVSIQSMLWDPQQGQDYLSPGSAAGPVCEQCGMVCQRIQHWYTLSGEEVESGALGPITTPDRGVCVLPSPTKPTGMLFD